METCMDSAPGRGDEQVWGFAPVASAGARVLVLGSMPGVASLRQAQYYAHPRNAFWPLAARICGFDPVLDYPGRLRALQACGIALWDVLRACERPGSLDADIRNDTLVPNDFREFLGRHPGIVRVCFNGAKAAAVYRRHVLPGLAGVSLQYVELPSTSPAHAAASFEQKLAAWAPALKSLDE
ncbi:DNA-deoxyinosine glycosylase [Achromobacter sp. Root83]|nr:DNA-deoxyinosine glycosylase [Achromobacter sp. Root83]